MRSFIERFQSIKEEYGPLCLGLDPSLHLLTDWKLPTTVNGLKQFNEKILSAAQDTVGIIKPQFAFYEQFGPEGMQALQEVIQKAHSQGMLVIADCKRCDISTSLIAYVQSILGPNSIYKADAMTLIPYMGIKACYPAFDYASQANSYVFMVVQSSNSEAVALQNSLDEHKKTVIESILNTIDNYNQAKIDAHGSSVVGAVMGATEREGDKSFNNELIKNQLILSPGIGAQGGSWATVKNKFNPYLDQVIPTCSRSILQAGPDIQSLKNNIMQLKKSLTG